MRQIDPRCQVEHSAFSERIESATEIVDETMGPLVYQKDHDSGGHFEAFERPDAIVDDLRTMFGKGGGAFGVVRACSGFDEHEVRVSSGKPMI